MHKSCNLRPCLHFSGKWSSTSVLLQQNLVILSKEASKSFYCNSEASRNEQQQGAPSSPPIQHPTVPLGTFTHHGSPPAPSLFTHRPAQNTLTENTAPCHNLAIASAQSRNGRAVLWQLLGEQQGSCSPCLERQRSLLRQTWAFPSGQGLFSWY